MAKWLLYLILNNSHPESILADLEEIYHDIVLNRNRFIAKLWYWSQIILAIPSFFKNSIYWSVVMFSNYFKVAGRTLLKRRGYSFINILGLAIGIACTFLILLWVQDELSYDKFHENADNLYVAMFNNGTMVTPTALSGYLNTEYPEIINTSRYMGLGSSLLRYNKVETREDGFIMIDPGFFDMFSIHFLQGNPELALSEPNSMVISERIAKKLFGAEEAMGKTVIFAGFYDYKITGIFENYPHNSHLKIECAIPLAQWESWGGDLNAWETNNVRTYVQLQNNIPAEVIDQKISNVVEKHVPQNQRSLLLQPVTKLHLYKFGGGGLITYVYLFSVMAVIILLIACINFMNLTTATSATRAKEVGMRKTVGANKSDLVIQFFGESILLTIISVFVGLVLAAQLLPVFNELTGKQFTISSLTDFSTILGIAAIVIFTGIIAGSYPALYLSRFQPLKVLKGVYDSSAKGSLFRKVLVTVQFSLSIVLIIGTVIVYTQIDFLKHKDLGFNKENIFYTSVGTRFNDNIGIIKTEMLQNPDILSMTMTNNAPYRWNTMAGLGDVHWEGQKNQQARMVVNSVDYDYLETFNLKLVQGRFFSKDFSTDNSEAFVVNEAAIRAMGLDSPIGKELRIWEMRGRIIGIVKDYNFESLHNDVLPMAMRILPDWYRHLCVRISNNNMSSALSYFEDKWKEIYPELPFEYNFLDETIKAQYTQEEQIGRIARYFTILAIFVASIGLFGLASFTAEQRTKEIGIRKVLGASVSGLMLLLSKEFTKWVLLANLVAWPIAWFIMNNWLQRFAYKTEIGWPVYILSGFLVLGIALITVSYQSVKAAVANPVDSLKYE